MSVQKKSLISNRATVKKALIASKPAEANQPVGETKALKAMAPKAGTYKKGGINRQFAKHSGKFMKR